MWTETTWTRLRRRAGPLLAALVATTSCGSGPPEGEFSPATCEPQQAIVLIHGTGSTWTFHSSEVGGLDPANVPASFFSARKNTEFDWLLASPSPCRVLTFSYDAQYFSQSGSPVFGENAWNHPTSPWNVEPPRLAERLDELLDGLRTTEIAGGITPSRFVLVAWSAGGIVPTYWAATRSDLKGVESIVVIDGVVSGSTWWLFELGCAYLPPGMLQHIPPFNGLGDIPCQFLRTSEYTTTVRSGGDVAGGPWWQRVNKVATLRANGDMLVPHYAAGIDPTPPEIFDPPLTARCTVDEWIANTWEGRFGCALGHGPVLKDPAARDALHSMIP